MSLFSEIWNSMKYKYLSCNKNYQEKLNEKLKKKFENTFKFSNDDVNKFMLLLRKGVYPYDHMNEWERFKEIALHRRHYRGILCTCKKSL